MMTATRRIPAVAAAAALVLVIAWYFLLWGPEAKSVKSAHKAHAQAEQKITQLQSQIISLQGLVKQIPEDNAKFAQLEAALPENPQLDQALNLLHQAAVQTGVTLANVAPTTPSGSSSGASPSQGASGGPAITLSLSVLGNPAQLEAFLSALNTLPRTIVVDKVSLSGGGQSSSSNSGGAASLTARIFYAGQPTP